MKLGAQVSVSGGLYKAFKNAEDVGAETLMFYTRSNRQWKAKPISEADQNRFKEVAESYAGQIDSTVVHANYLMNLASPEPEKWDKSYAALVDEITRTGQLGVTNMVMHPGSHMKSGEDVGVAKIAEGVKRALEETADTSPGVIVCLETMAGQGTNLGYKFEHLAGVLEKVNDPRLGVCFDTCHVFTAGYDLRTPEAYEQTMQEFDRVIGLDHIKCFHFNDTKHDLGSRKDRHQHIGQGFLGTQAFANFVNDSRWANHPAHIETPKSDEDEEGNTIDMDPVNLATLRSLVA